MLEKNISSIVEFLYCWALVPRIAYGTDGFGNLITKLQYNAKFVDALNQCDGNWSGLPSHTALGTDEVNNFLKEYLI